MAKSVLPVAKGVTALALGGSVLYVAAAVGRAQDVVEPPSQGYVAPVDVDTANLAGPTQPIFYRHDIHAGQYRMDCRYCHYTAEVSPSPGLPTMSTCRGCHLIVGLAIPEVQKLQQVIAADTAVQWVEVHKLPPHVHFPHQRHVNADPPVTCQTCHGPIQEMVQVYQYSPMKMGWCLDCHESRGVTTDCTVCHY